MKSIRTLLFLSVLLCLFAVQGLAVPTTVMNSPASGGTGLHQVFTFTVTDTTGTPIWGDFSFGTPGANSCMVEIGYSFNYNSTFSLFNDDGATKQGPYIQGSGINVSNTRCTQMVYTSYMSQIGNNYTVVVDMSFSPNYTGSKTIYAVSGDANGHNGWQVMGTWTPAASQPPGNLTINPTSETLTTRTFTVQMTDPSGTSNIDYALIGLGGWSPGCMTLVRPNQNTVAVVNDNNSVWQSPVTIGSSTNTSNSYCQVNTSPSSLYFINSTTLAININVTAKAAFSGNGITSAFVAGFNGLNSGTINLGTWTPGGGGQVPPDEVLAFTRDSLRPAVAGDDPDSVVSLTQANSNPNDRGAIPQYFITDQMYYRIRGAKPLSQVWVKRITNSPDDVADWLIHQPVCATVNGQNTPALADATNGGCLLGTTDALGSFDWSERIWNGVNGGPESYPNYARYVGMVTLRFYVGSQTPDPNVANTTRGPMNEDNYIGPLIYWAKTPDGNPALPAGM